MKQYELGGRGKLALNSRAEYDRCKIHRLTIDKDEEHLQWGEQVHDGTRGNVGDGTEGERVLLDRRKQMDKNNFGGIKCTSTQSQKRGLMEGEEQGRKSKKRKYVLVG